MRKTITQLIIVCMLGLYVLFMPTSTVLAANNNNQTTEYEVYRGSGEDEESLTDVMGSWGTRNKPDAETMQEVTSWSQGTIGFLTSCIIWIIFAALFFTTACDLLYLGVPGVRNILYSNQQQNGNQGQMLNNYNSQGQMQGAANQSTPKQRCLISADVKSILSVAQQQGLTDSSMLMKLYFKKRAFSLGLIAFAMIVLLGNSLFTDMGMNIGGAFLKLLGF